MQQKIQNFHQEMLADQGRIQDFKIEGAQKMYSALSRA